jgi:hypothetical protein
MVATVSELFFFYANKTELFFRINHLTLTISVSHFCGIHIKRPGEVLGNSFLFALKVLRQKKATKREL